MKPKKKYGFASYISTSLPRKDKEKNNKEPLGKLLPNGFRVGEKVYYIREDYFNSQKDIRIGKVVESPNDLMNDRVWCYWSTLGEELNTTSETHTSVGHVRRYTEESELTGLI